MHDADAFLIAQHGVGLAHGDGGVARAHLRLSFEPQRREGRALGRLVELGELHLTDVATLLAGVMPATAGLIRRDGRDERGTKGFFGRAKGALELDVRDVQGFAALVVTMRLGVLRQRLFDIEPRRLQQFTDRVLIFEAVHASLDRTSLGGDTGDVLTEEAGGKLA